MELRMEIGTASAVNWALEFWPRNSQVINAIVNQVWAFEPASTG